MADLHHGSFSYSTGPTASDLKITSLEDCQSQLIAANKFEDLATIFTNALSNHSEEVDKFEKFSGDRARESARPRLSFVPIHALALGLEPFEEEALKAIVFGNVSTDNYIDIFWDIVTEQSEQRAGELVVYEAERSSEPRFVVCFRDQVFDIRYIRCDNLVREYPDVAQASDGFLQDLENQIPEAVQDVVKMIQRGADIRRILDQHPAIRKAYSFLKRWVAIKGLSATLPDNQIFKALLECHKQISESNDENTSLELSNLISGCLTHMENELDTSHSLCLRSSLESYPYKDWLNHIAETDEIPVEKKMRRTHTIRVMVTYSGVSPMKGAQWLLMVQRKLAKLKDRIERALPETSDTNVIIWPYRLVQPDATATDSVYEGNFVLGLNLNPQSADQDMETVKEIAENWRHQTEQDRATLKSHCFIRFSYTTLPPLKICSRKWPRLILTSDNIQDTDSDNMPSKTAKPSKLLPSSIFETKAPRFRTAAEVLNRLKHDPSYNLDEFVIGYLDRVKDRVLEKAAAEWERESTAEEFIPEHRIVYFKRYAGNGKEGEVVWGRREKVDLVFNSS